MAQPDPDIGSMLRLSRTYEAPRERVFRAWTEPEQIRKWWGVESGYTTTISGHFCFHTSPSNIGEA